MHGKALCRIVRIACIVLGSLAIAVVGMGRQAEARITSITITTTTSPAFGGASFGTVGQYEQLDGVATGEIDPNDPLNAIITDIGLAPRTAQGTVRYSMNFSILKPKDLSRSNHTLLYDVVNRGNKAVTGLNIGGSATTPGDGFLERQGYTIAWSGWEGDITTGIRITLPVAKNPDGSSIIGRVRAEYILNTAPANSVNITAPPVYAAVSADNTGATLTRRIHQHDPQEIIPNSQWAFADCSVAAFPGTPDATKVCVQGGFDTNHIYELVYTAKDPTVAGIGFAATRDFISFLRNSNGKQHGSGASKKQPPLPSPPNPLGTDIQYALIYGASQSGRWIRESVQLGFNEDENHRQVVEGAIPHIASNRGAFNVRFAQPTRLSGTQHTEAQFPGPESPATWGVSHDQISGVTAGQLDRCRLTNTCPVIVQTVSDTEFWQSLMSLNITDSDGRHDIPLPPTVRLFQFSSTQHGGGNALMQPLGTASLRIWRVLPKNARSKDLASPLTLQLGCATLATNPSSSR